jgi:hypothetical protein
VGIGDGLEGKSDGVFIRPACQGHGRCWINKDPARIPSSLSSNLLTLLVGISCTHVVYHVTIYTLLS